MAKSNFFPILSKIQILHIILLTSILMYLGYNITKLGIGEIMAVGCLTATILIGVFAAKKDLSGMVLSGILFGAAMEFTTEYYWIYSLKVYIYKDISLFVILGWGYSFTLLTLFSNFSCKLITKRNFTGNSPSILMSDAVCGTLWLVLNEFLGIKILHLWTYNPDVGWNHMIPFLNYPIEAVIGSMLIALLVPSFVRTWREPLSWTGAGNILPP